MGNIEDTKSRAIELALKDICSDPCWQYVSKRHRYAKIEGTKVGVVFATNSNFPEYDTYALNCAELERLRAGRETGKVDEAFVVALRINGANGPEYRGRAELSALQEKSLQHNKPKMGRSGEFWSLSPIHFDGCDDDTPF